MLKTGILFDHRYEAHATGPDHAERPARTAALIAALEKNLHPGQKIYHPRSATHEELSWAHTPSHIERVAATAGQGSFSFDADTPVCSLSYETALLAAGGLLTLLDAVMTKEVDNAFALVRPPGHHAERDRPMGFCLFNNVAVGAEYLRRRYGLQRILILDFDVHHGNGTQEIFYDDPRVLFMSLHQSPLYPGTGAAREVGHGPGAGFTVNMPLPAGSGDRECAACFDHIVAPICQQFAPEFVLISAGFDAHHRDPLASMQVTEQGFAAMTRKLLQLAQEFCNGRCAAVLEGGYDLTGLVASVQAMLAEMSGKNLTQLAPKAGVPAQLLEPVFRAQNKYWKLQQGF